MERILKLRAGKELMKPCLVCIAALQFGYVMSFAMHPDEHMYESAAYLLRGARMYHDFTFFQTPLFPLAVAACARLAGTTQVYLVARLVTAAAAIACTATVYAVARRLCRDPWVALSLASLFALNEVVSSTVSESSNYGLGMALCLLATASAVDPFRRMPPTLNVFLVGVFGGLGASTKLYNAAQLLPLAVALCTSWRRFAFFAAGVSLGLSTTVYYAVRDPALFAFDNVTYHVMKRDWWQSVGQAGELLFAKKLSVALWCASQAANVLSLIALGCCVVLRTVRGSSPRLARNTWLLLALTATSLGTAFVPAPFYYQYYGMHVPFLLLVIASLAGELADPARLWVRRGLLLAVAVELCLSSRLIHAGAVGLSGPRHWTPVRVRTAGQALARQVRARGCGEDVVTLGPLLPLEGGLRIPPAMSTGLFLYQVGDFVGDDQLGALHGTSPSRVAAFLDSLRPAAIVVGVMPVPGSENELESYARQHGFEASAGPLPGVVAWLRPRCVGRRP